MNAMQVLALTGIIGASFLSIILTMKEVNCDGVRTVLILKILAVDFILWVPIVGAYWFSAR